MNERRPTTLRERLGLPTPERPPTVEPRPEPRRESIWRERVREGKTRPQGIPHWE
jgi:hypothetical protein